MSKDRMMLRSVQPDNLVENEAYLVCRTEATRECFLAVWTGKAWVTDGCKDHDKDWPDAVFENPFRAKVTESTTMEEYQRWVKDHVFYDGGNLTYPTLGLCGEAGEFADKVKKSFRDNPSGVLTDEMRKDMVKELGDVMFYVSMAAEALGSGLDEVVEENRKKIESRRARGVLAGSGDNR